MTPAIILLAVVVTAAAVIATSAREPRFAARGMIVALVGSAYATDPLPGLVALAARLAVRPSPGTSCGSPSAVRRRPRPGWRVRWPRCGRRHRRVRHRLARGGIHRHRAGRGQRQRAGGRCRGRPRRGSPVPRAALGAASRSSPSPRHRSSLGTTCCGWASGCCCSWRSRAAAERDGGRHRRAGGLAIAVLTAFLGAAVAPSSPARARPGRPRVASHHPGHRLAPRRRRPSPPWPGMCGPYGPRRRALPDPGRPP